MVNKKSRLEDGIFQEDYTRFFVVFFAIFFAAIFLFFMVVILI